MVKEINLQIVKIVDHLKIEKLIHPLNLFNHVNLEAVAVLKLGNHKRQMCIILTKSAKVKYFLSSLSHERV